MKQTIHLILSLFILHLATSCTNEYAHNTPNYRVKKADFIDAVIVNGFAEPVESFNIYTPESGEGQIAWLIDDGSFVNEGDEICLLENNELSSSYDEIKVWLESAEAEIIKTKANHQMQIALLEAQKQTFEAEELITGFDSIQLKFSADNQRKIKALEMEKAAIEKSRFEKKYSATVQIQQSEVRSMEIRIQRLRMEVDEARKKIELLSIKAPRTGLVILSKSWITGRKLTIGDLVWSSFVIATMPETKEIKVKMLASEENYKRIQTGDTVEYNFDALPDNYAIGRITSKSHVGQAVKEGSKVKVFEIEASVDSTTLLPEPGYSAQCRVLLKKVSDTISVPLIAVFEQDSMKVVYVKQKKGYAMHEVKTGLSSQKEIIIEQGLRVNEYISLSQPPKKQITKNIFLQKSKVTEEKTDLKNNPYHE